MDKGVVSMMMMLCPELLLLLLKLVLVLIYSHIPDSRIMLVLIVLLLLVLLLVLFLLLELVLLILSLSLDNGARALYNVVSSCLGMLMSVHFCFDFIWCYTIIAVVRRQTIMAFFLCYQDEKQTG